MTAVMTSRERILAALRCEEVDYVPMIIHFREDHRHAKATWRNERERLVAFRDWGWDTHVRVPLKIRPSSEVRIEVRYEADGDGQILHQTWRTPAGTVEERLRLTDDWDDAREFRDYLSLFDDFRSPRYVEVPIKTAADLAALEYILPVDNPLDTDAMLQRHREARALAEEFGVATAAVDSAGLDWLIWLFPAEEAVLRASLEPEMIERLLSHISAAYLRRLEVLLDLGIDFNVRRGWYEGADFWSPKFFRQMARPALESQIELTHRAGIPFAYVMDSGVTPMLPELAALPIDCLFGVDPVLARVKQDLREIRRALPGKSLWGGLSGPEHLCRCGPEATQRAVEEAFAACGRIGFLLGPCSTFRYYYPWENMEACERAWRRLR